MQNLLQFSPVSEKTVAVIPVSKIEESALVDSITDIRSLANKVIIKDEHDFSEAGLLGQRIKQSAGKVKDFFKPLKDSAHKAHKAVCDREAEMLKPLNDAEKVVKGAMNTYTQQQREEQRRIEAEARRKAQEEANRKLDEAIKQSLEGNEAQAEAEMSEAAMMESLANTIVVPIDNAKATGISQSVDWEVVSIEDAKVPIEVSGFELRPVNMGAIMRLIRSSKGKVIIPGVTYRETVKTSIRR